MEFKGLLIAQKSVILLNVILRGAILLNAILQCVILLYAMAPQPELSTQFNSYFTTPHLLIRFAKNLFA